MHGQRRGAAPTCQQSSNCEAGSTSLPRATAPLNCAQITGVSTTANHLSHAQRQRLAGPAITAAALVAAAALNPSGGIGESRTAE